MHEHSVAWHAHVHAYVHIYMRMNMRMIMRMNMRMDMYMYAGDTRAALLLGLRPLLVRPVAAAG